MFMVGLQRFKSNLDAFVKSFLCQYFYLHVLCFVGLVLLSHFELKFLLYIADPVFQAQSYQKFTQMKYKPTIDPLRLCH